jgi:hypothetical protein
MKIRINGNTIRLRLSAKDVADFVHEGNVSCTCNIGLKTLTFLLKHGAYDFIYADLIDQTTTVYVPMELIKNWDRDQRVGFERTDDHGLHILIEKDFQCLKPRANEDESNLYPNPQSNIDMYD